MIPYSIYSPTADGFEENDLMKEEYTWSKQEDEDFGLLDMVTEGYADGSDQ